MKQVGTAILVLFTAACTSDPSGECSEHNDCRPGYLCHDGDCLEVCNTTCQEPGHECIEGLCRPSSSGGDNASGGDPEPQGDPLAPGDAGMSVHRIFVTAATTSGGLPGGLSGADELCTNDSNNPEGVGNGTWRAILGVDGVRELGTNWVLKPSTAYYRTTGELIDTTDANGWFTFPFDNSIGTEVIDVWTGFYSETGEADSVLYTCNYWTSSDPEYYGVIGVANEIDGYAIDDDAWYCDEPFHLYCVEAG